MGFGQVGIDVFYLSDIHILLVISQGGGGGGGRGVKYSSGLFIYITLVARVSKGYTKLTFCLYQ